MNNKIRIVYLYVICFVSLMMLFFGTITTIRSFLSVVNIERDFNAKDIYFESSDIDEDIYIEDKKVEPIVGRETLTSEQQNYIKSKLKETATSFVVAIFGLLLYAYHFRKIKQESLEV